MTDETIEQAVGETIEQVVDRIDQQQRNLSRGIGQQIDMLWAEVKQLKATLAAHQINPPDARFPHSGNAETPGEYGASE
jgi:hypothetical protein